MLMVIILRMQRSMMCKLHVSHIVERTGNDGRCASSYAIACKVDTRTGFCNIRHMMRCNCRCRSCRGWRIKLTGNIPQIMANDLVATDQLYMLNRKSKSMKTEWDCACTMAYHTSRQAKHYMMSRNSKSTVIYVCYYNCDTSIDKLTCTDLNIVEIDNNIMSMWTCTRE